MGSGKTYWGEKAAGWLGWRFVDLDRYIEEQERMSISKIFQKHGEAHFRKLENKYLMQVEEFGNTVIAAGGGTPCFYDNIKQMNRMGKTYYLKTKPETAAARLKNQISERPLLHGKKEKELIAFLKNQLIERESFYLQARHTIESENLTEKNLPSLFQ